VLNPEDDHDTKVAQLLTAFRRGCRLARLWNDVFRQDRLASRYGMKVGRRLHQPLAEMGRLGDLAALLDDDDHAVQATAASWLLEDMPERCMPIVQEISEAERRFSYAGSIACGAVDYYELTPDFKKRIDEKLKRSQG
jgi:hypothetical protein